MDFVKRNTIERKLERGQYRRDLILTAFGGPGKSGTTYARMFAQESRIRSDQVVEFSGLRARYEANGETIQAIIIVDDFIGTGDSACVGIDHLNDEMGDILRARQLSVFFVVVCGLEKGKKQIEDRVEKYKLPFRVFICDILDEQDNPFSRNNQLFLDDHQREKARTLAHEKGLLLDRESPMGYGNSQSLVVFDSTCPNNTLPILWKKVKGWQPLFPRAF
jgi:hypothetical protein